MVSFSMDGALICAPVGLNSYSLALAIPPTRVIGAFSPTGGTFLTALYPSARIVLGMSASLTTRTLGLSFGNVTLRS